MATNQDGQSGTGLQAARDRLGITQQQAAERLAELAWYRDRRRVGVTADMVSKWERGLKRPHPYYRGLLCLLFDAAPAQLWPARAAAGSGSIREVAREPVLAAGEEWGEVFRALGEHGRLLAPELSRSWEAELMQRRELLKAMGLGSLAAAVGAVLPPTAKLSGYADDLTANEPTLSGLAALAGRYQALYHSVAPGTLLTPVLAHLRTVDGLLPHAPSAAARRSLLVNHSQVAALAGRLSFFDLRDPLAARGYFGTAYDAAVTAGDRALAASALAHLAFVPAAAGEFGAARDYLDHARASAHGDMHPWVRSWLAAVSSEVATDAGDQRAALAALDDAQRLLPAGDGASVPAWFDYYNPARLAGFAGYALLRGQKTKEAAKRLTTALAGLPPTATKQRAIFQVDLASVRLAEGELEEACRCASAAAHSVAAGRYATAAGRLRGFRHQLRPYVGVRAVRALDQQLATL